MVETNPIAESSNTVGRVSVFAAATGVGSWPGSSAREAAEVVVGELHTLTHLVELPDRGVGADMIGRAAHCSSTSASTPCRAATASPPAEAR